MLHHKKPIVVITLLLGAVIFVATTAMKSQDDKQPEWKNLKVLPKNITKDELDKVMHDWSGALGQHCGFCHAKDAQTNKTDFASDAKPEKLMARKMMTMTEKINKKFFKEDGDDKDKDHNAMMAVSCYTCHNGKAQPETEVPKGMGGEHHDHGMAPGSGTPPTPPVQN